MEGPVEPVTVEASHEVLAPERQTLPVVFASPHSGDRYPPHFVAASRLDPLTLRRSEDCFVDEIFEAAPRLGAPLIRALFPRAFVDANREPFELDPAMFEDALPPWVNAHSPRVRAGLGTIARVVADGAEIYRGKLRFADAERRIKRCYEPYHAALAELIRATKAAFGFAVLLDCHSMPSVGGPMDQDPGMARVDIVLGDCFGASCDGAITRHVESVLGAAGYTVTRNIPYSGGYTTVHYGRPGAGIHALQIEINRGLYMDEWQIRRGSSMARVARDMQHLLTALATIDESLLTD